jgi:drug/metabolite transporter (DMT)-like permease
MEVAAAAPRRAATPWQVHFALLTFIWGSSFLCMKVAVADLAAIDVALGRVGLGAAALCAVMLVQRAALPRGRAVWGHMAVAALFANTVPFALQSYGETYVSSVLGGLWNATVPLCVLAGASLMLPAERPSSRRLAGFLVGLAGVVVVLGPWDAIGGASLTGQLLCAGASLSLGFGFPYMRRFLADLPESGVALTCGQLLCSTAQLAVLTVFIGGAGTGPGADTVAAMLGIGVIGTGVAFAMNYTVVRAAGATTAAAVTYFVPLVSTALGIAVLGEGFTWNQPAGAALVLAGVALSERAAAPVRTGAPVRA